MLNKRIIVLPVFLLILSFSVTSIAMADNQQDLQSYYNKWIEKNGPACKVGGVSFVLVGEYPSKPKYFEGKENALIVSDKNGARYYLPFTTNAYIISKYIDIEGVTVETDMKFAKQEFILSSQVKEECNFPITDLYNESERTTIGGRPSKNTYVIRYMINGELLTEFNGTLMLDWDDSKPHIAPYSGIFKFACGEIWGLRQDPKNPSWRHPELAQLSPIAKNIIKVGNSASIKESKRKAGENDKKLAEFRKNVKVGSRLYLYSNGVNVNGTVLKIKGEMIEVQVEKKVINGFWSNIIPYMQWFKKQDIRL